MRQEIVPDEGLRVDQDLRAGGNEAHEVVQVRGRRVEAAGADGARCRAGVDREAVAAPPAAREVRLVAREREDAAAVDRGVVGAVQLVGDAEAADRRGRDGGADTDRDPADDAFSEPDAKLAPGKVDLERYARVREAEGAGGRVDPAHAPISEGSCDDGEAASGRASDGERLRRAELRQRGEPGHDGAV